MSLGAESPAVPAFPRSGVAYVVFLVLGVVDAAGYSVIAPVLPAVATVADAGTSAIGLLVGTFPHYTGPASRSPRRNSVPKYPSGV